MIWLVTPVRSLIKELLMPRANDPYDDVKVYHYAAKFDKAGSGAVSALCYTRPHAIDLTKGQSWVLTPDRVTCSRCKRLLRDR